VTFSSSWSYWDICPAFNSPYLWHHTSNRTSAKGSCSLAWSFWRNSCSLKSLCLCSCEEGIRISCSSCQNHSTHEFPLHFWISSFDLSKIFYFLQICMFNLYHSQRRKVLLSTHRSCQRERAKSTFGIAWTI